MSSDLESSPPGSVHGWAGGVSIVSRLKGGAFKYTCLAAALFGIVTLVVLLGYVAIDAFELRDVDPAWVAVVVLTIGLPTATFWWSVRGTPAGDVAKLSTGSVLMGLGLGGFFVASFLVVTPSVWAVYVVVALIPAIVVVTVGDRLAFVDHSQPTALGVGAVGLVLATVGLEPLSAATGLVPPWLVYVLTVAVPVSLGLAWWSDARDDRIGASVGVAMTAASLAIGIADAVGVVSGVALVIPFLVGLTLPITVVLADVSQRPGNATVGLYAPLVVVVGIAVAVAAVDLLGIASPDSWLRWEFLQQGPSRTPENAGLYPPIIGSIFMIVVMIVTVFPLGVGAAIYLEEYAPRNRFTRLVQVNLANLAGVPSVVYGLLGLAILAQQFGLGLGTVITASLTVGLLVLPIVIISAQEAIRAVPKDLRQASYGMGASRWQTTRRVVLPEAFPGILTGTILALGRAIGETAPLIMIGAAQSVSSPPDSLTSTVTAMPLQIYSWRSHFDPDFRYGVVAAGVITLLIILLGMNAAAILLRNRYENR